MNKNSTHGTYNKRGCVCLKNDFTLRINKICLFIS